MKIVKWFLIGLIGLIVLAFIAIGILLLAIDRGEYKQEIIQQVEAHTGRSLTINGDLDISLFPWIGITIGELAMSNATGFGDDPFVQAKALNVKIEVLPLLRRELRVDTVQVVGVALDLQRNIQGISNWDDLVASGDGESKGTSSSSTPSADTENSPIAALAIGGVDISDAKIRWRDHLEGSDITLRKFNLGIGEIKLHETFPLSLSLVFDNTSSAFSAEIELTSEVAIDIQRQEYQLGAFLLKASMNGENLPEAGVPLTLSANILSNLVEQTIAVGNLDGSLAGVPFVGQLDIRQLDAEPSLAGTLNITAFNVKDALQKFNIPPPPTARDEALTSFDARLAFVASQRSVSLEIDDAHIDTTTVSGKIDALLGAPPEISFSMAIDSINLDDYLPPADDSATASQNAASESTAAGQPLGLPLDAIRTQNITGEFSIGQLTVANLKLSGIQVPVSIRAGVASVGEMTARLYNGSLDAGAEIDASGPQTSPPSMSAKVHLFGVQVGSLLDDLNGDGKLSGIGDVRLDLRSRGDTLKKLIAELDGGVAINFRDGAIEGINIAHSLRVAKARLRGKKPPSDDSVLKTDFSQLSASGTISNGVLHSKDLDMRSPLLRVTGAGDVDLNRDYVDYKVRVLVTDDITGQGGDAYKDLSGLKLSIPLRGHFDDLGKDFTGTVYAAIKRDASDKIDKKIDELKTEKKKQQKKLKKKLEKKLKDKLQKLLE